MPVRLLVAEATPDVAAIVCVDGTDGTVIAGTVRVPPATETPLHVVAPPANVYPPVRVTVTDSPAEGTPLRVAVTLAPVIVLHA